MFCRTKELFAEKRDMNKKQLQIPFHHSHAKKYLVLIHRLEAFRKIFCLIPEKLAAVMVDLLLSLPGEGEREKADSRPILNHHDVERLRRKVGFYGRTAKEKGRESERGPGGV